MLDQETIEELSKDLGKLEHNQVVLPLTEYALGYIWWASGNHKSKQRTEQRATRRVRQVCRKWGFRKQKNRATGLEEEVYKDCVIPIGIKDMKRLKELGIKMSEEGEGLVGALHEGFLDMLDAIEEIQDRLDKEDREKRRAAGEDVEEPEEKEQENDKDDEE